MRYEQPARVEATPLFTQLTDRIEDDAIHINEGIKDELWEIIYAIVNEDAGGESRQRGFMFKGIFGTGKDYTATWIRTKVSDILGVDIPMLMVGSLRKAEDVMDLYKQADGLAEKYGRCIIFDCEVDKRGKRGELQDADKEAVINQLLIEMQSTTHHKGVVTLTTTNRPDIIDPAYRRGKRIAREVTFGSLDKEGRLAIGRIEAFRRDHQYVFQESCLEGIAAKTFGAVAGDIAQIYIDAGSKAILDLMRSLESIAENVYFGEKQTKAKIGKALSELGLEKLALELKDYAGRLTAGREQFLKKQKIDEKDPGYRRKIIELAAKKIYDELNPNLAEKERKKGYEPIRWIQITEEHIKHVLDKFRPSALKDMPFEETSLNFNFLGGVEAETTFLGRIVEQTIAKGKEGTAVYLYGPDGAGVTSLARSIAGQYGYNLVVLYGADQESKWFSQVKDKLLEINHRAKSTAPTILVFDMIKYLAQHSTVYESPHKQTATSALKTIIRPTNGVLYVATGETLEELDRSMLGLFPIKIKVPLPESIEDYQKIWCSHLNRKAKKIDFQDLAALSKGLMGGDIYDITRTFEIIGVPITQTRLETAINLYLSTGERQCVDQVALANEIMRGK